MLMRVTEIKETHEAEIVALRGSQVGTDPMRVPSLYVNVPAAFAERLKLGTVIVVEVRESLPEDVA